MMSVTGTTFSTITGGATATNAYGGVLYIASLNQLTISTVTASDFSVPVADSTLGGGSFLYYANDAAFT